MKRVTGIGGIFFKCTDPKALKEWYKTHLGIDVNEYGATFDWKEMAESSPKGSLTWSRLLKRQNILSLLQGSL